MRINHNISSMVAQNSSRLQDAALRKSLEKLSTGLRINRASDDAAGLSVSEQLRTQVRGLKQAQANTEDGIALLQIAEGAASEINDILQRMRELAIQSANGTLTSTDRSYTNAEFQALMEEISRITVSAQYNGMTLLDGGANSFGVSGGENSILHVGANNNNGVQAATVDTMQIHISPITLGSLGLTLIASVGAGGSATAITNAISAFAAITSIDSAIRSVNTMRADLGTYINRLEHTVNNIANQHFNTQDAEARIRDVDFATETTGFTKAQILSQSSTAMLAQANAVPQTVLQLLV